jgi:hypothetical protein
LSKAKDFSYEQDKMVQNSVRTESLSAKNLSFFTVKNLLNFLTKVGLNFVHFALMKVSEMKSRVHLCSKSLFSTNQNIFNKMLATVELNLAESFRLFQE